MLVFPFQISTTEYSICFVLGPENLERMKEHDPAIYHSKLSPDLWGKLKLSEVIMAYGDEEEQQAIIELIQKSSEPRVILDYITRGFRFRPEAGDTNGPYRTLKTN